MVGALVKTETNALTGALEQVRDFHVAMGQPVASCLGIPPHDRVRLRAALQIEECLELVTALINGDRMGESKKLINQFKQLIMDTPSPVTNITEVADGLADLIYVTLGCALEFGIPLEQVFVEVHRSNMSKSGGGLDESGKCLKGPKYSPPDIGSILDLYA